MNNGGGSASAAAAAAAAAAAGVPGVNPAAVGFPGGVPTWAGSDMLVADTFKFTVASWRRLNPDTSPTNDFVCNVGAFVPKAPFVRRVSLVDVHVPSVQRTIEMPWSRLYFSQGIRTMATWRTFGVQWATAAAPPSAVGVVLPLPIDTVAGFAVVAPGVVRVTMTSPAPRPIQVMAALAGPLTLVGVPDTAPITLTPATVRDTRTAGPASFDVASEALAAAVQAAAEQDAALTCAALVADPIPNDAALAKVLSAAVTVALNNTLDACASPAMVCDRTRWSFTLQYCGGTGADEFSVAYSPGGVLGGVGNMAGAAVFAVGAPVSTGGMVGGDALRFWVSPGPVAAYMGLDGQVLPPSTPMPAAAARVHPPCGFAQLTPARYAVPTDLSAAVSAAASTFSWPAFALTVSMPAQAPATIGFPGGHGTLHQVAAVLQTLIAGAGAAFAAATIAVQVVGGSVGPCGTPACPPGTDSTGIQDSSSEPRGLAFVSTAVPPVVFSVGFPFAPSSLAPLLGYPAGFSTPMLGAHMPSTGLGAHVPAWDMCCGSGSPLTPQSDVIATISPEGSLALTSTPFQFKGTVRVVEVVCSAEVAGEPPLPLQLAVQSTAGQLLGLSPGMRVALVAAGAPAVQVRFAVLSCTFPEGPTFSSDTAVLVQEDGRQRFAFNPTLGDEYTMVSLTAPALTLYMQTPGGRLTRTGSVPPAMFGFAPMTYTSLLFGSTPVLVSPGLVRIGHDPYLLLCLGFSTADTAGLVGDIYYPIQVPAMTSTLVFAPILRAACDWRPEYDRNFFKTFPGAGIHLSYVRVRILNPDGRPYLTHGHPVTVMLRAEVQMDTLQMGGPGHLMALPAPCVGGTNSTGGPASLYPPPPCGGTSGKCGVGACYCPAPF